MNKVALVVASAAALAVSICFVVTSSAAHADVDCTITGSNQQRGVMIHGTCAGERTRSFSQPTTKNIFCGRPSSDANALWNPLCGAPRACSTTDPATGKTSPVDAFATLTLIDGAWSDPVVWCPSTATPAQLLGGIREQAERLLPHVGIGIAPPSGVTLVNIQTILWADTVADRRLASVTVIGRRVALRVHLSSADWTFGDGTTDRATGPGTPYDEARNPCRAKQCPDYYGHTYRRTGHLTIELTLAWHAQYNPGGGWIDIPGELTGPAATKAVWVKQARAILIPNP